MFKDSHLRLGYIENKMATKQAKHQRMFPELEDKTPEYLTYFSSQTIKLNLRPKDKPALAHVVCLYVPVKRVAMLGNSWINLWGCIFVLTAPARHQCAMCFGWICHMAYSSKVTGPLLCLHVSEVL